MAYSTRGVTGLNVLLLIVLLKAGSWELVMTGSKVQKAHRLMWLLLREDVSASLVLSEIVGKGRACSSSRLKSCTRFF